MTLTAITLILAGIGCVWTGLLAIAFLRDPAHGMTMTSHTEDQLPRVMVGRYVLLVALAVAALIYRDLRVIAFLYSGFAFLGFADAFIYSRVRKPAAKHVMAGISALIVVLVALAAHLTGA
jgi:hypothetical protein